MSEENDLNKPHIVITGNPVDGFNYHGPFDNWQKAMEFGEYDCKDVEWHECALENPGEDTENSP